MDRFTALLDANVIYPAGLRDLFLRLADRNLYRVRWSEIIQGCCRQSFVCRKSWPEMKFTTQQQIQMLLLKSWKPPVRWTFRSGRIATPLAVYLRLSQNAR